MSPEPYWIASQLPGPILQTELLSNVIDFRVRVNTIGTAQEEFEEVTHPLAMVVTQDCELDLDHKARYRGGAAHRFIDSVLLCDVDDAERLRHAHRESGAIASSRAWEAVKINQNERYHLLQAVPVEIAERQTPTPSLAGTHASEEQRPQDAGWRRWLKYLPFYRRRVRPHPPAGRPGQLAAGFQGTLAMDFRRVFTMPMPELLRRIEIGEAVRHCSLSPIYRDNLSNRFYGYHMRVALEEAQE